MAHPYPRLLKYPQSGLPFNWGFDTVFDGAVGPDGVSWAEVMWIPYEYLDVAMQLLCGYSWRDAVNLQGGRPVLRRQLPWQHPYLKQLFVRGISKIEGIRAEGTNLSNPGPGDFSSVGGAGGGPGAAPNQGPWTKYNKYKLHLQFHRPPYFVRSDSDILDGSGVQQEWLRYVDKEWSISSQMLTREGSQFVWSGGAVTGLPGSIGQMVTHSRVTRRWYEIPEAAIFGLAQDAFTPNGLPTNLTYTYTNVVNPITGYGYTGGLINPILGCVNSPIDSGAYTVAGCTTAVGDPIVLTANTASITVGDAVTGAGVTTGGATQRTGATVLSISAGVSFTMSGNAVAAGAGVTLTLVTDSVTTRRLFGCKWGTLRLDGIELVRRPLHLPPFLMNIPAFGSTSEPISQNQYDVVFHYDLFDPPRPTTTRHARGHNLMPWSGNGLWYPINSQMDSSSPPISGAAAGPLLTPFHYADLADTYRIL